VEEEEKEVVRKITLIRARSLRNSNGLLELEKYG
jgi:hypothetical protein